MELRFGENNLLDVCINMKPLCLYEGYMAMDNLFEVKISKAAKAGWWTLLIGAGFLTVQWITYLFLMSSQPAWLLFFLGPGVNWDTLGHVLFWLTAIYKFSLWLLALPVLWLTLWSRQLRKHQSGS